MCVAYAKVKFELERLSLVVEHLLKLNWNSWDRLQFVLDHLEYLDHLGPSLLAEHSIQMECLRIEWERLGFLIKSWYALHFELERLSGKYKRVSNLNWDRFEFLAGPPLKGQAHLRTRNQPSDSLGTLTLTYSCLFSRFLRLLDCYFMRQNFSRFFCVFCTC